MDYTFFDAKIICGKPFPLRGRGVNPFTAAGKTVDEVLTDMKDAGISKAVAVFEEQYYSTVGTANELALKTSEKYDELYTLMCIVPSYTGEIKPPMEFFKDNFKGKTAGFLLCGEEYNMGRHPLFYKEWLEFAQERNIPVYYTITGNEMKGDNSNENDYIYIINVLERYPNLTLILNYDETWPNFRKIYTIIANFPNVHLLLANGSYWMGSIEDFVQRFGSERLLFSTEYPRRYIGGAMMALVHACITEDDKAKIASRNMERLLGGIIYD